MGYRIAPLGAAAGALVLLIVAMSQHPRAADAATMTVSVTSYLFSPTNLTVAVGDTVTWTNMDVDSSPYPYPPYYGYAMAISPHTTTSNSGLWNSGDLVPGASYSFTFTTPGVYSYYCMYHASLGMTGTITVSAPATATPAPTQPPVATSTPTAPPATATPTRTATPSASPTSTNVAASPTAPAPSATSTSTGVPTAPTAAMPGIGGKGLAISSDASGVHLSWSAGVVQSSYLLARLAGGGVTTIPLGAGETSYTDQAAPPGQGCYVLVPLGTNPQAVSDYVCAQVGVHGGSGIPQAVALRLNQSSTANITWGPPQGPAPDQYILASLDGKFVQFLPATTTSASAPVSGTTCFLVAAMRNGGLMGFADPVCGLPGIARNLGG